MEESTWTPESKDAEGPMTMAARTIAAVLGKQKGFVLLTVDLPVVPDGNGGIFMDTISNLKPPVASAVIIASGKSLEEKG